MGRRATSPEERARTERLVAQLDAARSKRTLSVHDLSTASGVHYETVRAVLGGRSAGPSFFIIADLARALQLPLEQLDKKSQR